MFTRRVVEMFRRTLGRNRFSSSAAQNFQDIPTPKGLPFIGTRLAVWRAGSSENLHEYIDRRHRELGPIYREQLGPITGTFVADAEAIRSIFSQEGKYPVHIIPQAWVIFNEKYSLSRGLLFMNGPEWLEHRKLMNNILLRGDLKWIEDGCDVVIDSFIQDLKKSVHNEEIENLDAILYRAFLDVLVSLLLGSESYVKHKGMVEPYVQYLAVNVNSVFETTVKLQMIPANWAAKLRLKRWNSFEIAMKNALHGANVLVDKLMKNCEDGNGLLRKIQDLDISVEQIKAIVADLVLAAADTTAYTMQWMLYLVAKDIDIQEKIRQAVSKVDSSLLKHVLRETLRLYPVAPFITRFLPHEAQIAGYNIPSNSLIVMSIYTTGRDEKYFKDATIFDPGRWERGGARLATKQASLPFAMGARSCIGKRLAEYELQKMLAGIVENFSLKLCNTSEIKMVLRMIAVPSQPIKLKLKRIR